MKIVIEQIKMYLPNEKWLSMLPLNCEIVAGNEEVVELNEYYPCCARLGNNIYG